MPQGSSALEMMVALVGSIATGDREGVRWPHAPRELQKEASVGPGNMGEEIEKLSFCCGESPQLKGSS